MCVDTICQHHTDPAVQYLEEDYQYLKLRQVVRNADGSGAYTEPYDSRTDEWWDVGAGPSAIQPMFTLKDDKAGGEHVRWSAVQGPVLPYESEDIVEDTDNYRRETYWLVIYGALRDAGHEIPARIQEFWNERERKREEEYRASMERFRQMTGRVQESVNSIAGGMRTMGDAVQQASAYMQGYRADYVIRDEAVNFTGVLAHVNNEGTTAGEALESD